MSNNSRLDSHIRQWCMQVWENYVPAEETATASGSEEQANGHASSDSTRETVTVTVTEVVSGNEFYIQVRTVCWLL